MIFKLAGFYYNLLGQVSAKTNQFLDSIKFYLKCFCVRSPYLNSKESIGLVFQHIRDLKLLKGVKSNLLLVDHQFLELVEMLYSRIKYGIVIISY